MNMNIKTISPRLRDLIVAVLTAFITYLMSSCAAGFVVGTHNKQIQEVHGSADSAYIQPSITITR